MSDSNTAPHSGSQPTHGAFTHSRAPVVLQPLSSRATGIIAALASAFFLGLAPIFGKQAILLGLPPLAVVALRTLFAALLLLILTAAFYRRYLYIYPAGLLGCLLAGSINGIGSLFYYASLARIDAGLGQLLYALYPLFLMIWLLFDHQLPSRLTIFRLILALPAILLLTQTGPADTDLIGVLQMLVASALYALHLPINQRVLYDMPAPTVTLYTLLAMSAVVVPSFLFSPAFKTLMSAGVEVPSANIQPAVVWGPVIALTLVTFFSRLTLFLGVKHLGGLQTALLGLSEMLVALVFAHMWLGERFSFSQWIGALLLIAGLMLVMFEQKPDPRHIATK